MAYHLIAQIFGIILFQSQSVVLFVLIPIFQTDDQVKLGLFNDEGQVLDKWEIPTVKDNGGEKVLPDIAASIKNKMQEKSITAADLVGVGIGAPGAVNAEGFMVNGAVNIGWGSFDLAETLKKELDLPVRSEEHTSLTGTNGAGGDDTSTDTGSQSNGYQIGIAFTTALPHFTQGCHIGIVTCLHGNGQIQFILRL